jgi:Alkaline phosphatase
VTSDHSSAMVYSGFATPKNYSILGMDKFVSNVDKKSYQLLTYSSGLGNELYNESLAKTDQQNSYHKAAIPSTWANHGGDDVPLYAIGVLSNILFSGSMDQSYIPHAIAFAMCLFRYQDRCQSRPLERRFEAPRERVPSSIHLLKQKLLEASLKENPKDNVVMPDNSEEEIIQNSMNITELGLYSTSDLIGNATDVASGKCTLRNSWAAILFAASLKYFVM